MGTISKLDSRFARSLIEASLDPLITINPEGKIIDMNVAWTNITGLTRERLMGTDFLNYFTEPLIVGKVYDEVLENGSVADSPLTIHHVNGKKTDVLFNGSALKEDDGAVIGAVIVTRDMSMQKFAVELRNANKELAFQNDEKGKRAEELKIANKELAFQNEEKENRAAELVIADIELDYQNSANEKLEIINRRLKELSYAAKLASKYARSIIEASLDPLFAINSSGKIIDVNEATLNAIQSTREEITGTDFTNYFAESEEARKAYQQIFTLGFINNYPLTIKDGKNTEVLCNGSGYKDDNGNVVGVVIVAREVTEQKRIERELIEARVFAELATSIAEDAKSKAESAAILAENAVKAKQQFLSNMSHEIRTPMNAIIGFTKVLLKTNFTAKQKEYLTAIKVSGDALIVLINDILDLAKVDAGKMVFEQIPFKMSRSLSAMIHIFEAKIQEKNLKLVTEFDPKIPKVLLGDPVRLHQIILNLISNAIKFTSKGKITVSVNLLYEDDEKVNIEFAIKDTGIGIAENKVSRIFENFQQASSSTSRLYGGTGLGLAIVKQLVESQGGSISVKSKLNEGSTFSFILSFKKTNTNTEFEPELPEIDTELENIKILVVEDIALNQLLMKTLLDDFGFESDIADNGKIAIEKLQKKTYDIILMDLQMPEMNGFDTTDYIRSKMHSKIPIIALTADVTTVDLDKCKSVGMNDYLSKPVDERVLYAKITGLIKKNSAVSGQVESEKSLLEKIKCTDLAFLLKRTKSNPDLMMQMISLYLKQTPPLIAAMKQGLRTEDWNSLYSAVHKLIPSFAIMGINPDFETMAKKIQEYAGTQQQADGITNMVLQLEIVLTQSCQELAEVYKTLKNKSDETNK